MAHTFSRNYVHVICSTKDRRKTISKEMQPRLWAYLAGIIKKHEMIALAVGGTDDHMHVLFHLPPKLPLAKAVLLLKANSSKWMRESRAEFSWQEGYGAFSISERDPDAVIAYVREQRERRAAADFVSAWEPRGIRGGERVGPASAAGTLTKCRDRLLRCRA